MSNGNAFWHNLKQLTIAIDQLAHIAIFMLCAPFKRHYADETLSSHCWRLDKDDVCKWPRRIIDLLLFFDKDHCRESYESERLGRQLPPELRKAKQDLPDELDSDMFN